MEEDAARRPPLLIMQPRIEREILCYEGETETLAPEHAAEEDLSAQLRKIDYAALDLARQSGLQSASDVPPVDPLKQTFPWTGPLEELTHARVELEFMLSLLSMLLGGEHLTLHHVFQQAPPEELQARDLGVRLALKRKHLLSASSTLLNAAEDLRKEAAAAAMPSIS
eukprot:tig00000630_g2689.t1